MSEQDDEDDEDDIDVGSMTDEEYEALPDAPPELAAAMEEAFKHLVRETPLGAPCPDCGSVETKHVSLGNSEGERYKSETWTVVLPPGISIAYCECDSCGHSWEPERV